MQPSFPIKRTLYGTEFEIYWRRPRNFELQSYDEDDMSRLPPLQISTPCKVLKDIAKSPKCLKAFWIGIVKILMQPCFCMRYHLTIFSDHVRAKVAWWLWSRTRGWSVADSSRGTAEDPPCRGG
ncbi:hypothetical protein TNCV_3629541 [Trichonephila clavipes]|nr:hypothetical protein TNCV_3629541 [Trichonephila clavipes]